ncbi:MAG: hypothetical protein K6F77_05965 [Lachnospiraceae bacterium]|nr:hypothetical protein [Lachnospiraceae bacterium]
MYMNKITERVFAVFMVMILALLSPANRLEGSVAQAADSNIAYIKNLKVFVKTHGDIKDAESWCSSQPENKDKDKDNDWYAIPGDLNEGASGALKREVAVFICYQKTYEAKEAVRDIALMNEGGNYSVDEYKYLLDEQKDMYTDMVNDMKDMLKEYRTNYNNKVTCAVQAHDFLNTYIEDDSGKKLGDLLLDVSDEDLATILLQANGQVVIAVQEQLTSACDTNNATWLDRMSKIGSYDNLKKKFMTSYNINSKKAIAAMDQKYKDKATIILNSWNDIRQHIDNMDNYVKNNGLDDMSEEEYNDWLNKKTEENSDDAEFQVFMNEKIFTTAMAAYKYEDSSIFNFFVQDATEFSGNNLRKLYPIAASLTDGQFAALNQTVSLYSILLAAINATGVNDTNVGMSKELNNLDDEDAKEFEKDKEELSDKIDDYTEIDPISIYEGVDREMFNGGVAVTSTAKDFGNARGTNWTDSFVESGAFLGTAIGLAAGSLLFAAGAAIASRYATKVADTIVENSFNYFRQQAKAIQTSKTSELYSLDAYFLKNGFKGNENRLFMEFETASDITKQINTLKQARAAATAEEAFSEMDKIALNRTTTSYKSLRSKLLEKGSALEATEGMAKTYRLIRGLKIGLTVFAILLAAFDITMSIITLCKYYNRDHVDIPKFMVDMTYDENKERSFVSYKSVRDDEGSEGDLNGGGGKQWLAIYMTKDADAGDPILAPNGINTDFVLKYKDSKIPEGYSPLHMFGEPNVAQNLTFSDGESGWSFNDKKGGIYLFFKRDPKAIEASETGTVISTSNAVFAMVGCLAAGMIIGVLLDMTYRRRREKKVAKQ